MASRERLNLTSVKRDALAGKAVVLTESWQRTRRARLHAQLAVNAEIKQRCLEADHLPAAQPVRQASVLTPLPCQPRNSPFKAWLAAAETPFNHALTYIGSVLGLQRLASHQTNGSHG